MSFIKLDQIKKIYLPEKLETAALNIKILSIKKGEFVSLIGSSGSGKSTLLNVIGLLDRSTKGNYFLNQTPIHQYSEIKRAKIRHQYFGYVFQAYNLIPSLTSVENVIMNCSFFGKPVKSALKKAKEILSEIGLSNRLGHYPSQLSGGQQQRVAIARRFI